MHGEVTLDPLVPTPDPPANVSTNRMPAPPNARTPTVPLNPNATDHRATPSSCAIFTPTSASRRIAQSIDKPRRKYTSRKATVSLQNWFHEHQSHPYPTTNQKHWLSLVSGLSVSQVNTWFANKRRALKNRNKMTWMPPINVISSLRTTEGEEDLEGLLSPPRHSDHEEETLVHSDPQ
ncbi:unnamed protein product [Hymenolepis diminuta]|uniref:Homeobox domain-containing protein n=1 Tax=Hymenolepis diminuta TaxID=6216 RepID=A0A0R3SP03_HYMDI|nr:unnamed protein product [Hymenolepis diminuta]